MKPFPLFILASCGLGHVNSRVERTAFQARCHARPNLALSVSFSDRVNTVDSIPTSLADHLKVSHLSEGERNRPVEIVGHRGALYEQPENTLASFRAAWELGCDAVELDVFQLNCGTLVAFHGDGTDEDPGYLYSYAQSSPLPMGKDNVLDYSFEELLELPFDPDEDVYPCPPSTHPSGVIPTLERVLELARDLNLKLKLELKGPGCEGDTVRLVERTGALDLCTFSSFNLDRIANVRRWRPNKSTHRTGALFNAPVPLDFLRRAQAVGATEVHLPYDDCRADLVEAIHGAGMNSMAWLRGPIGMSKHSFGDVGNEDERMYRVLLQTGVQGICCNRPGVLHRVRLASQGKVYQ